MALLTGSYWAVGFAIQSQLDVAVLAQTMKHRLNVRRDVWIGFVTVEAKALTGVVGEIVVASNAVVSGVVSVGKGDG